MKKSDEHTRTLWWCETCHASGLLQLAGVGGYGGVTAIADAHRQHEVAKWLRCEDVAMVRVQELPAQVQARR